MRQFHRTGFGRKLDSSRAGRKAIATYSWALVTAGIIGTLVAVIHGILTQRLMVAPVIDEMNFPQNIRRLIPLLLHFSTVCWFFGGIALIATPWFPDTTAVLTTAAFVGAFYTFGAIGNLWGTSGRHPGWMLLAAAVALIIYGSIGLAG